MLFVLLDRFGKVPPELRESTDEPIITLKRDTWNDYGFRTLFKARLLSGPEITGRELGDVKIMRRGQRPHEKISAFLEPSFQSLGPDFCSLGQDASFYIALRECGMDIALQYLEAMKDAAYHPSIRSDFQNEEAFRISLLRTSSALDALENAGEFFGAIQTVKNDRFEVRARLPGATSDHRVKFDFTDRDGLPHRISVLVGLNGVGKTALMARIAFLITRYEAEEKEQTRTAAGQTFETLGEIVPRPSLYTVIAVSFSAFDDFEIPRTRESDQYRYIYCGLRKSSGGFRSTAEISNRVYELVSSMSAAQRKYLSSILPMVLHRPDSDGFVADPPSSRAFYASLSAGQRITLNIICEILVHVQDRSLILLDEPETHLHPQLLSTLLACLSDILAASNSFAIIATHSPIVVQQVPSRSVSVLKRLDGMPYIEPPRFECFGENLTEIVRTVFESIEGDRDYEQVIDDLLARNNNDADAVEQMFDRGMGLNARLYLRSKGASSERT